LYKLLLGNKIIGRSPTKKHINNDTFSEMDIQDAEYEDVEDDG
jgi:hypothetical protein